MSTEIILVFVILVITMVLFAFEIFTVDKIAFFIIVSLVLCNLVSPKEAISGFSNSATIAVLALMILAIAMEENGVINWLTSSMSRIRFLPLYFMAPIFMIVTAGISAFISTTAVVIVFIKIINQLSEKYKISQSKLLLPISFAGILGGSCTLMGTSTNLLVNVVATDLGATKLGFFEFSMLGLIFLTISVIYLTITIRWLPWDKQKNFSEDYKIDNYITQITINKDSDLIGKTIGETFFYNKNGISLLKLTRNKNVLSLPGKHTALKQDDKLLITTDLENLTKLNNSENLTIYQEKFHQDKVEYDHNKGEKTKDSDTIFVELLMLPGASLLGKKLGVLYRYITNYAVPIAIKKHITYNKFKKRLFYNSNKNNVVLEVGDRLLVKVGRENIQSLEIIENIVILKELEPLDDSKPFKKYFSLFVLLGVITLAASGLLTILVSSLVGVTVLLLTNNLDLNNVYKKVNWQIFFLLAGMIPLGIAMHNSGADMWISEKLLGFLSGQSEVIIIGTLFLATMIMSGVISNNATAIIMTPIAISLAQGLNMDFKAFILAIMFAANFSFFTPVGYQTNTLIYGIGNYKFKHFFLIGGLLSLILWIVATLLLTKLY